MIFMKMSTRFFFIILALMNSSLNGMKFDSPPEEIDYWIEQYFKCSNEQLLENKRIFETQLKALSEVLARKGLLSLERAVEIKPELANTNNYWIDNITFGLPVVVTLGMIWTITEAYLAYKNMSQDEWNNAIGFTQKSALIAFKACSAMVSRPGQVVALGRTMINKIMPTSKQTS